MEEIQKKLQNRFPSVEPRESADWPAFNVPEERLLEVCHYLRDDLGYTMLVDVTAVDWSDVIPRFTVIYHVFSVSMGTYLRLAVNCADAGTPSMLSVSSIWPAANWHEREVYDMFGIHFKNHPDLRRILMWDDYPYFPLRKEFPLAGIETELPPEDQEVRDSTDARVIVAPMMGGPFHAASGQPMSKAEPRAADQSWTEKNPKPLD